MDQQQQQYDNQPTGATNITAGQLEEITSRLDQMNVDMGQTEMMMDAQEEEQEGQSYHDGRPILSRSREENYYNALMERDESIAIEELDRKQHQQNQQQPSDILIVTNVDSSIFHEQQMKANFESLFLKYDPNVTFRYLKSFRRVRLDFSDWQRAEEARRNLSRCLLGQTEFKCYAAQMIRPNQSNNCYLRRNQTDQPNAREDQDEQEENSIYLNIPKLTKQFLISPPASPPVGWEPVEEQSPCIDVQLLSAIVNLVPGKVHEIHAGSDSQPGIFVEVCEEPTFERMSRKSCSRIPRTPNYCQPTAAPPFAPPATNRGT